MARGEEQQTFTVASDERLREMIRSAKDRLVVVAPALTEQVADALAARFRDEGRINITVVLDADPEVYRLGYGDTAALAKLRAAAAEWQIGLNMQPGVRIGMMISDQEMMIFSPVPRLIEAGSTAEEKPNAIVLGGRAADQVAEAAGAGQDATQPKEIGKDALTPAKAGAMQEELRGNPPRPFNIARAVRVFSSQVQYVEMEVRNARFGSREVALPPELFDVADDELRRRMKTAIRPPENAFGPFKIKVRTAEGEREQLVDEKWIRSERNRIEREYTFEIRKYGRLILRQDWTRFHEEIDRFRHNIAAFRQAVMAAFDQGVAAYEAMIVKEFLPRWQAQTPKMFDRWNIPATEENLVSELSHFARQIGEKALTFEEPSIDVVYKDVSPDSAADPDFIEPLKEQMRKRRVPPRIIDELFSRFDAARGDDVTALAARIRVIKPKDRA